MGTWLDGDRQGHPAALPTRPRRGRGPRGFAPPPRPVRHGREHHQGVPGPRRRVRAWLGQHADEYPDAFVDQVGAEAAVTAWRRHLIAAKAGPSTVNQALAAVALLYEVGAGLRLKVKRARVPRPGEPDALTPRTRCGRASRRPPRRP